MVSKPPRSPALSTTTSRRHRYTYFTDRDSDGDFHGEICRAGIPVERHDDHFPPEPTVEDWEWIDLCSRKGWIALTNDRRIRHRRTEADAVMRGGVRLFVTVGKRATHSERGQNFVASLNLVEKFLDEHPEPFIARIYLKRRGIKPWLLYADWLESLRDRPPARPR